MSNCREIIIFGLWDKGLTAHMQPHLHSKYHSFLVLNVSMTDLS